MKIRDERPSDVQAIHDVTKAAFADMPKSSGGEQDLIEALRKDGALLVSLVAEMDGEIVGHIAFSRVTIGGVPGNWFDLGPASVRPDHQSRGIGEALILAGLERIRAMGAEGCVLLGYPAYYRRFGFAHEPGLTFDGRINPNFQQLTFAGPTPAGEVTYHRAFYASKAG